jgi:DNA polymerase-3 subunit beta
MKVTLLTANLQKKLSFLNHAVSSKNQLPVLLNILIEAKGETITVNSTDLEIGIEVKIPATIEEEGATTVPAKMFTELINSLSEESVMLHTTDNKLEVVTKKTNSVFQTISADEFPSLFEEKGEKIATLLSEDIQKDFASVVFAASLDTTRPALSGVLVRREDEGFLLVATDGYRLSLKHYKTSSKGEAGNASYIIPARVFKELLAMKEEKGEIQMYVASGKNQVLFEQERTVLVGRLIESEFPNFEKIIPSDFSVNVSFDREEMQKAVKICSIFARDAANIIKFSLRKDQIIVSSQSPALGENTVTVDAKLNGEENEIAFNARYLHDMFANTDQKEMVFEMTGPLNPGVFKIADDPSYLHLIMPIRVQE